MFLSSAFRRSLLLLTSRGHILELGVRRCLSFQLAWISHTPYCVSRRCLPAMRSSACNH